VPPEAAWKPPALLRKTLWNLWKPRLGLRDEHAHRAKAGTTGEAALVRIAAVHGGKRLGERVGEKTRGGVEVGVRTAGRLGDDPVDE
jgi:hypothetical protein